MPAMAYLRSVVAGFAVLLFVSFAAIAILASDAEDLGIMVWYVIHTPALWIVYVAIFGAGFWRQLRKERRRSEIERILRDA